MTESILLALETSTRVGSVALYDRDRKLAGRDLSAARRHASELLPSVADMLRENGLRLRDVGLVAFSQGPGSFTGLRIAVTIARTLHESAGCRVVAVPTLEVIACNVLDGGFAPASESAAPPGGPAIAVLTPAGRGLAYTALYDASRTDLEGLRCVIEPAARDPVAWLASLNAPFWGVGDAAGDHSAQIEEHGGRRADARCDHPCADQVARLAWRRAAHGAFCSVADITPLYLRPPACEEAFQRNRAAAQRRRSQSD
jgi:tRNA threonylcarbamoyl adenosine modification protein YeaZ